MTDRGVPPRRSRKPLARSKKHIPRHAELPRPTKRIEARKADPSKRRFASLRNAAFQEFVREHPCAIPRCDFHGGIECAHIRSRGAGGDDVGNCVPLCWQHHAFQHAAGIKTFQRMFNVDLEAIAMGYANEYRGAA